MKVCTNAYTVTKKDNYFSVMTDRVEIRILFLTDSILRIRAGFDGDFAEESYSLVMTAWEDRMDEDVYKRQAPSVSLRAASHGLRKNSVSPG